MHEPKFPRRFMKNLTPGAGVGPPFRRATEKPFGQYCTEYAPVRLVGSGYTSVEVEHDCRE